MGILARGLACAVLLCAIGACGGDTPGATPSPAVPSPATPAPVVPPPAPAPLPAAPAPLTGRVTTEAGVPLANARVAIRPNPNSWFPSVSTNQAGEYRFENLTPGNTLVWAEALRFQPIERPVVVDGVNRLDFALGPLPQVSMSGLVQDADTLAPIARATVTFLASPGSFANDGTSTMSGADGRYRCDRVYTANSNIGITAPGYQEWCTGFHIDGETTRNFQLRRIGAS